MRTLTIRLATVALAASIGSGCATHRAHPPIRPDVATLQGLEAIESRPSDRGLVLTVPDRLFDADKPDLKPDGRRELAAVAAYLKAHAEQKALIEGHTDNRGDDERRRQTSLARGTAVETFLLRNGVDPERLEVRGVGAARPIATNETRAGRRENRRVEIVMPRATVASTPR
jgi:outer membrane protein OmpA-like peptidoglycan-associated protein